MGDLVKVTARRRGRLLAVYLVACACGVAQTSNIVFGSAPIPTVAPGSIVDLFVQGIGSKLTGPVSASGFPLPTILAGISAALSNAGITPGTQIPILAVTPASTCVNRMASCGRYVKMTVQIPFELYTDGGTKPPALTYLTVSENGIAGAAIELWAASSHVEVLVITRADGSPIYYARPVKGGDELVIYCLGLGLTTPAGATGQATPQPPPTTLGSFQLNFDYRPNAPPSGNYVYPGPCPSTLCDSINHPVFAGLTPGFAGLYQINFIVPPPPPGTQPCTYYPGPSGYIVNSNLTVSVMGPSSRDGMGICVDPTPAP